MYGYNLDFHYDRKNIFYLNIFELKLKKIEYMYYVQIVWFKLKQTKSRYLQHVNVNVNVLFNNLCGFMIASDCKRRGTYFLIVYKYA